MAHMPYWTRLADYHARRAAYWNQEAAASNSDDERTYCESRAASNRKTEQAYRLEIARANEANV